MKYFHWFKGLVFIALACSFTANGSTVNSSVSKKNPAGNDVSKIYNVSVSSGQAQNSQASAKLSISGENSKVTVEKEGSITLSAGNSIQLLPGTKISSGGFLYATIEPGSKTARHKKKEIRVVTVEENKKIEEQSAFSTAYDLFKPFPVHKKGNLHAGDAEQGSFTLTCTCASALSPEQQRKVALDSRNLPEVQRTQMLKGFYTNPVAYTYHATVMMVLRL